MSKSNKSKNINVREIGPMYAFVNGKWAKNVLNRKIRHSYQSYVNRDLSYDVDVLSV